MSNRVPVVYKGKPLMPMRWKRAKKLLDAGKAKLRYEKDGIWYLKLKFKPSGTDTQDINLGIDPGTHFDGLSVVSDKCHHENIELIHNKKVSERMSRRSMYRGIRRGRLRHRECKNNNRTSNKMIPTIRSMFEFRKFTINELVKLYPITDCIIENVAYNHWNDDGSGIGKFFSQCEIGKTALYNFVQSLGIKLITVRGYITKNLRVRLFKDDPKLSNKGSESFYAHCVDSFVLATLKFTSWNIHRLNTTTRFIKKIWCNRRELFKHKAIRGAWEYFRYKMGGVKVPFIKLSKLCKVRVKVNDSKSNHGLWDYIIHDQVECYKKKFYAYGGTIVKGQSRIPVPRGLSKKVSWTGDSRDINSGKILGYRNRSYQLAYC